MYWILTIKFIILLYFFKVNNLEAEDLDFVGQVFKSYSKGEVELPEKKAREKDSDEQSKAPSRPLDLDSAQDFLILLTYKIKN